MAIRGKIGTKITINPIYMTNRRCPGSFGKIEDLVANPGDLTNFAPIAKFTVLTSIPHAGAPNPARVSPSLCRTGT